MKAQMKVQKYLCLIMLIMGVLGLAYAFCYCSGALGYLGTWVKSNGDSSFKAAEGKYDATLYTDVKGFNDAMMYCGIVMILTAVLLYITGCNSRRNYYVTNYVATGLCAGGNIIISVILMALNGVWLGRFMNVDFEAWEAAYHRYADRPSALKDDWFYSDNPAWFYVGFVVYALIIIASVLLILNMVWKIKLMQGEKKLLNGENVVAEGGAAV